MRPLVYFVSALLFAAGLVISGMTQPHKVIGFLDFFGSWDPSLAFVMGGAVAVHFLAYRLVMDRPSPVLADTFHIPSRRDIDKKLVLGSVLFGAGWGLAGYCPGPALASLGTGTSSTLIFVASMLVGMIGYAWVVRRLAARRAPAEPVTHESEICSSVG